MRRVRESCAFALRLAAFFMIFAIDIRVKADVLRDVPIEHLVQWPAGCWQGDGNCAVQTRAGERVSLEFSKAASVTLDQSSTVVRTGANEIRLVSGVLLVRGPLTVHSEFGDVKLAGEARAILTKSQDEVQVAALAGAPEFAPRGSNERVEIPAGFANSLGRVRFDGRAETGLPMAFPWVATLKVWGRLSNAGLKAFTAEVEAFAPIWKAASLEARDLHVGLYHRTVASLEAAHEHATEAAREKAAHDREINERFRKKVFDE